MGQESREIRAMKAMEWERVKGGLQAILSACSIRPGDESLFYYEFKKLVEAFVHEVEEENGWF